MAAATKLKLFKIKTKKVNVIFSREIFKKFGADRKFQPGFNLSYLEALSPKLVIIESCWRDFPTHPIKLYVCPSISSDFCVENALKLKKYFSGIHQWYRGKIWNGKLRFGGTRVLRTIFTAIYFQSRSSNWYRS